MKKVCIIFPGYGSQFIGMAKELYDNSRVVQEYFEQASHCLDMNFVKLCFASSDIELSRISNAYPALYLVGLSTAALLKEHNIKIDFVAGYGIGEYGALSFAGGLNFPDGLYLLKKLANFYTEIRESLDVKSVLVSGLSAKQLKELCKEYSSVNCCAQIAIYENKKEHLVTGHRCAVDAIIERAQSSGIGEIEEKETQEGLHTPIVNELFEQLKVYLTKVDFKDLEVPLITGINGKEIFKAKKAQNAIIGQIIKPVYWNSVLKQCSKADILVVTAPSKYLVEEIQAYYPDKTIIGIETLQDIEQLSKLIDNKENESVISSNKSEETVEETENS